MSQAEAQTEAPSETKTTTEAGRIPVTVLTGYLGSGKTTLLNRILTENHGKRYAVIVNEFGEIGIDNDLIVESDEEIYEMNNGCICCTVRGDLIRILGDLRTKRDTGKLKFDRVIIETTGMADPGPVAQTFFLDESIGGYFLLDSVLTLVDAKHANETLDQFREAQEQVGFADRILLSKTDLVSEEELRRARTYLTGRTAIDLQKKSTIASTVLFDEIYGNKSEETLHPERFFAAVTAENVRALAADLFSRPTILSAAGPTPW